MPYILTKDGYKIFYDYDNLKNKKPLILFIHSFLMDSAVLKNYINYFKNNGHPVIYFDIRGHGKSDVPKERDHFKFTEVINDINLILKELKIKRKIILFGYSLGGMISIFYTLKDSSKVKKIILVSSSFKHPSRFKVGKFEIDASKTRFKKLYSLAKKFAKTKDENHKKIVSIFKYDNFLSILLRNIHFSNVVFWSDEIFSFNATKKLSKIKIPMLFLIGDKDEFFNVDSIKTFSKNFPNIEINVFSGWHSSALLNEEKYIKTIENFVNFKSFK
jgi:pimeloyl-ACP methyl ester carboxylesterase